MHWKCIYHIGPYFWKNLAKTIGIVKCTYQALWHWKKILLLTTYFAPFVHFSRLLSVESSSRLFQKQKCKIKENNCFLFPHKRLHPLTAVIYMRQLPTSRRAANTLLLTGFPEVPGWYKISKLFACYDSFYVFCRLQFFSSKLTFSKNSFIYTCITRVSKSLDPDQARCNVGPDLDRNCLQRLSSDDETVR